ncbi:DUF4240 domain-containing protein [Leptolyngbya sp. AN03gr2]|uniref:DUF4240 domain-containing protein n=1 Tax=unclassified Leptolyngbya TaxID=2650499 RepID=UPI003D312A29
MTEVEFWELIEQSRPEVNDCATQTIQLQQILSQLSPDRIVQFQQIFHDKIVEAYRWDLWGVAALIQGFCSDDGFEYFCRWLVGQGREAFVNAIADPETVADLLDHQNQMIECEELFYAALFAYEAMTGEIIPELDVHYPRHPAGERWTDGQLAEQFPKVVSRYPPC